VRRVAHSRRDIGQGHNGRWKEIFTQEGIDEGSLPPFILPEDDDVKPVLAQTIFGDHGRLGRQPHLIEHLPDRGEDL
jgi:hypothetical protein